MAAEEDAGRAALVQLLHTAAELELALNNAYLYAACSLKSAREEFSAPRRAVQFEFVRSLKKTLLTVAHEEMVHLHYVQCMLRALGEPPHFVLPVPTGEKPGWEFGGWRGPTPDAKPVVVRLGPCELEMLESFVTFESTDALHDMDPLGTAAKELYDKLREVEMRVLYAETLLYASDEGGQRSDLRSHLRQLLDQAPDVVALETLQLVSVPTLPPPRFLSIADLYMRGILPLYREAFHEGWVVNNNLDLNNEIHDFRPRASF